MAAAFVFLLAGSGPAWAHAPDSRAGSGTPEGLALVGLAAVGLGLIILLRLGRRGLRIRVAAVALVGALGVFAFADGLHSVHHLPDRDAASRCALAVASSNVHGVVSDDLPIALPPRPHLAGREEHEPAPPVLQPAWAATGRAPPPLPA